MRINICKFGKLLKQTFILELIMKALMSSASFSLTCPFKPMQYTIKEMKIPSFIPLPGPKGHFCLITEVFARSNGTKKIEKYGYFETHMILS
jgi:hypothetical protein